ncbi:MAG: hypothetical protein HQK64_12240 [Desulfamplus sp.]|nr:hypothetical protein [Desulfamplus sp.]
MQHLVKNLTKMLHAPTISLSAIEPFVSLINFAEPIFLISPVSGQGC